MNRFRDSSIKGNRKILQIFRTQNIFSSGSAVEWLKRRACDQHGVGSKPTHAILLCPWKRHLMALSPTWWSWQVITLILTLFLKN